MGLKFARFILLLIGNAVLALVVCLFVAGVSSSGVTLLELTHYFFWACLVVGVAGAALETALIFRSVRWSLAAAIATSIVLGGVLYGTNIYFTKKRMELDASNHPPAPIEKLNYVPPKPPVPIVKTPKERVAGTNQATGSGNIVRNTVKGNNNKLVGQQNCPGGICAGGDINGNPIVNNYIPPQRHLSDEQKTCIGNLADSLPSDMPKKFEMFIGPDADAMIYGTEIAEAFRSHNNEYKYLLMLIPCSPGVWVQIYGGKNDNNGKDTPIFADAQLMVKSLVACHIPLIGFVGKENTRKGMIELMICGPPRN